MDDRNNIKERILKDVGKSIKLIQQFSVGVENSESYGCGEDCSGGSVNSNSWLVQSLCCHIDLALRYGLREPSDGFWPLLHDLSHSNTFQVINGLQNVFSPLGKGLIWLHHTLMEGSLQSYLQCLSHDKTTLQQYYTSGAILRDTSCSQQLLTLLAGLENISFNMNGERADLPEATGFSGLTSMTSSLSSPVDSGVALLDSDGDVTSSNEATVTECDAASLKEDEAALVEPEDNNIIDNPIPHVLEQTDSPIIANYEVSREHSVSAVETGKQMNYDMGTNSEINSEIIDDCVDRTAENLMLPHEYVSEFDDDMKKQTKLPLNVNKEVIAISVSSISNPLSTITCDYSSQGESLNENSVSVHIEKESLNRESCILNSSMSCNKWNNNEIMSKSVGSETIVKRRQRKKNHNGPDLKIKRVSFHEDLLNQSTDSAAVFSASFLPPNPVIKCDVVKGRYSWCAEGDSPFLEQRKNCDTRSEIFLSASAVNKENNKEISMNKLCLKDRDLLNDDAKQSSGKSVLGDSKLPPVTERGIPEGQEDPPKTSSLLHLNSITDSVIKKFPSIASSIDWSSDTESDGCDHRVNKKSGLSFRRDDRRISSRCQNALLKFSNLMSPSKTSLLKRFMKSVTERKYQKRNKLQKVKPLYIPGAKPDPLVASQYIGELDIVYAQMEDLLKSEYEVGAVFKKALEDYIFQDPQEVVYKVFKVHSSCLFKGKSEPMLIVLSANSMYFIGLKTPISYFLYLTMNYNELEAIIVGPSRQTLLFTGNSKRKQILVTSNDATTTGSVVSHIEVAMRKLHNKPTLPAVKELELDDMKLLKQQLSKSCASLSDEELLHYSIIHLQDNPTSPPSTPLGPEKEGHLMFRPATDAPLQSWEPGYFILKGGVVYMFNDQDSRLPKRVIPLHGGQCQGCRRISYESRPHTFEIILGHKRSFQFAAADEYETSEWLQALVQAASGFYEVEQVSTTFCSLILTSTHIITCQENFSTGAVSVLTCAAISDLLSFSILSAEERWCVLEFACHEVHESSGDWAVYFATPNQMLTFNRDLEDVWKRKMQVDFPLQTINNIALCQICEETSHCLSSAWDEAISSRL